MSHRENLSWSDAPVVVDAANVAGSEVLQGCGKFCWGRVALVTEAWRSQIDPNAVFILVMDKRPALRLGEHCRSTYRADVRKGAVIEVDFADPEVLRLAEERDSAVISGDFYKDHRRTHPWLDGNESQFFGWTLDSDVVEIVQRTMGVPSDFSKTRAEERAELKGQGFDITRPNVQRALQLEYRCDTTTCWLHQYDPGRYTGLPDLSDPSTPRCMTCRQPLTSLGESPKLVQIKFADKTRSNTERLTLSPGDSIELGRDSSAALVARLLGVDSELISRHHARVDWDGGRLTIEDLRSKNGTTVRCWSGKQRGFEPPRRIGEKCTLGPRDEACLAGAMYVTRSARTFTLQVGEPPKPTLGAGSPTTAQDELDL